MILDEMPGPIGDMVLEPSLTLPHIRDLTNIATIEMHSWSNQEHFPPSRVQICRGYHWTPDPQTNETPDLLIPRQQIETT